MAGSGLGGIKLSVLLPIAIIIGTGLIAWGEGRYKIADNTQDIEKIEEEQEEIDGKVDTIIERQGRMDERLKIIQEGQGRQERTTDLILQELRRRQPPP
ncbi:hypothetical protein LCGC14_0914410 [marine sediment metagenome]|uniref:Uncharacterized protein n=1 Tax=marine sediment metagenome TaxID=412755 RepID=A0A0F9RZC3_9ZZZZ